MSFHLHREQARRFLTRLGVTGFVLCSLTSCEPKLATKSSESNRPSEPVETIQEATSPAAQPVEVAEAAPSIPLEVVLENKAGKQLEGTLLAKKGNEILFLRKADQKQFIVPLETLSSDDQIRYFAFVDANEEKIDTLRSQSEVEETAGNKAHRPLSLSYENAASYEDAKQRAIENGTDLLLVFLGEPQLSEDCTS